MSAQRHPYAVHPAALVLADHQPECVTKATPPAAPVMCCCGVMVAWCDFSAHQTGTLQQAGLLADGAPPETPTRRADLDQLINRYVAVSELTRAGIVPEDLRVEDLRVEDLRVEERRRAWEHLGYSPDQIDSMEQAITADGPPPETPTARVLAERADRRTM